MLSVSFLAATLNVMIFIAALSGIRIAERAVRNFSIARMRRAGSSLVVHDSDLVPFSIPWSIVKYRRHPRTFLPSNFYFQNSYYHVILFLPNTRCSYTLTNCSVLDMQ